MILRIVKAKVCGPHRLDLVFNDGVRKRVNVKPLLKGQVFKPLLSPSFFSKGIRRRKAEPSFGPMALIWRRRHCMSFPLLHR